MSDPIGYAFGGTDEGSHYDRPQAQSKKNPFPAFRNISADSADTAKQLRKAGALNAQARKQRPLFSGVLKYFPDALLEVAYASFVGNEQHNPGQPLHWDKEKSTDEADALLRHQVDVGTRDSDGVRHSAKVAWRALAQLQREIEAERDGVSGGGSA